MSKVYMKSVGLREHRDGATRRLCAVRIHGDTCMRHRSGEDLSATRLGDVERLAITTTEGDVGRHVAGAGFDAVCGHAAFVDDPDDADAGVGDDSLDDAGLQEILGGDAALFDAELPDFEFANAFLLGLDMRTLATGDDARFVDQFLERLLVPHEEGRFDDESDFGMKNFRGQIHAFRKGFTGQ